VQANAETSGFIRPQDVAVKAASATGVTDSGWIAWPYAAGLTAVAGSTPGYRKQGNRVFLRGMIKPSSGADITVQTTLGTLPAGYRPTEDRNLPAATEWRAQNAARVYIPASGTTAFMPAVAVKWVSLDGLSFFTD
jgi:hypothetical protein